MPNISRDTKLVLVISRPGWLGVLAVAAGILLVQLTSAGAAPQAGPGTPAPLAATSFGAGSLIIPMDTDATANHAPFNQNQGMWKSYGLLYRLLANGIPVRWAISETKTGTSDVDF